MVQQTRVVYTEICYLDRDMARVTMQLSAGSSAYYYSKLFPNSSSFSLPEIDNAQQIQDASSMFRLDKQAQAQSELDLFTRCKMLEQFSGSLQISGMSPWKAQWIAVSNK
ncbi:hypothetical protein E6O75_ATG05521 [Venturia nashicola]|uniref:Uncharacterized protein n=1 Tax=Venturia nashicola TaxID=86259 RepID=A0A4Z1NXR9_9PEZI|nr:hypothetical protein E6O75_ATG05521 [Venturia nashicola]